MKEPSIDVVRMVKRTIAKMWRIGLNVCCSFDKRKLYFFRTKQFTTSYRLTKPTRLDLGSTCEYVGNVSKMTNRAKWDDSTMIALCITKEINYFYCHSWTIQEKNITPLFYRLIFYLTSNREYMLEVSFYGFKLLTIVICIYSAQHLLIFW